MPDNEKNLKDRAERITARKKLSLDWMRDSFHPEMRRAYANYKAEAEKKLDEDGKPDDELTSLGSPLTFNSSRRMVARITANIPQFKFLSNEGGGKAVSGTGNVEVPLSEMIARTQMFQWDRAGMQRIQKKHVLQSVLFGWSPRLWYWCSEIFPRRKRINISDALQSPELLRQIEVTYLEEGFFEKLLMMEQERAAKTGEPPSLQPIVGVLAQLQEQYGKGNLLPVEYDYKHYEGPKADFLFVGDCFPEPHFQSIRTANWFIVNKLRDYTWLKNAANQYPELKEGITKMLEDSPKGTGRRFDTATNDDEQQLFRDMLSDINRGTNFDADGTLDTHEGEWLITEHHTPGRDASIEYMEAKSNKYLGKIRYPYDIAGRMAITDCVLIDDLVSGIGDSVARIMRGLHKVHSDQLGYRTDLVKNLLRPIIGTRDINLIENPLQVRKEHGFRLIYMRQGPDSMWQQQELAALAAAQAGLAEDQSILQQYFMFSSENNMSSMASSDPSSSRTAAGVNYMANQTDITTKDYNDAFLQSSLREDAEMMWLMNRSELTDGFEYESSQYNRSLIYDDKGWKENWVRAEPEHFQIDGEITVKPGSTLAEDDMAKQMDANEMMGLAMQAPQLFNVQKARDNRLIAGGHRHDLPDWIPTPPPEQPPEIKKSVNISVKWEELTPAEKAMIWERSGVMDMEPPPGMELETPPGRENAPQLPPPPGQ